MHALTTTSSRGSVRAKLMTTLFVAQVCGSTGHSISLAVGSIMAASITGTNTWSGVPIAVGALGTALASWPLARLMDHYLPSTAQIQAALNELGLTQQQGARLFRHDERTMRRWISGDRGIPQGIAILLQMLVDGTITVADVQCTAEKVFS